MLMTLCKKATELMELKEDGELAKFQSFRLRLHMLLCVACRNYERQWSLLAKAIARQQPSPATEAETEVLKVRIRKSLKEG